MDANNIAPQGSESQSSGNDLMSVFDTNEGSPSQQDGTANNPVQTFFDGGRQTQNQNQDQSPETVPDEKSFQSRYDKVTSEYNTFREQAEEWKKHSLFLNEIMTDEGVRRAFIAELAPDLIKTTNIHEMVRDSLVKEFGEAFEFDPEEAKKGYGEHFYYQERSKELYQELRAKKTDKTLTLKEIREKQKAEKEQEAMEQTRLVARLKGEFHADEETIGGFFKWAQTLEPTQLFRIYNYALKQQRTKSPSLAAQSGSGNMTTPREQFLSQFKH